MMYNSSMKKFNSTPINEPLDDNYHSDMCDILFHNMTDELIPECFYDADVIMSEISWSYGYPIFKERSNIIDNTKFNDYLRGIDRAIKVLNIPTFLTIGKCHLKILNPDNIIDVRLSNVKNTMIKLGVYNYDISLLPTDLTTDSINEYLQLNFNRVLDFSCGYGEHLLKYKSFVASDIDRVCLGYLKELVEK